MQQPKAEHKIKEVLNKRGIKQIFNTAMNNNNFAPDYLLNILHRETKIPKSQIISYLNNRKGFNYTIK